MSDDGNFLNIRPEYHPAEHAIIYRHVRPKRTTGGGPVLAALQAAYGPHVYRVVLFDCAGACGTAACERVDFAMYYTHEHVSRSVFASLILNYERRQRSHDHEGPAPSVN